MNQAFHVLTRSRRAGAIALLVVAGVLASCGGSGTKSEPTAAVTGTPEVVDEVGLRALVDQQLQLSRSGDWPGLYATYAPEVKDGCSLEQFVAERQAQAKGGFDPAKVSQSITAIRGDGDHAYISWSIAYDGTPQAANSAAEDAYVRIDGRWYDGADDYTGCAKRPAAPGPGTPPASASGTTTPARPNLTPIQ
jgi:hypothetical protein